MIEIEDKIISLDIFEKYFLCDLNSCKGACCVKGDSGAPLTNKEILEIEANIDLIKPNMRKLSIDEIDKNGIFYIDQDNEQVTTLINKEECAFVYFDKDNIAKCSIEKTYKKDKITFRKPISCHLYPIRVQKLNSYQAINYNKWDICKSAIKCGSAKKVKIFSFLKDAIIRMWGADFYKQIELIDAELDKKKNL